MATPTEEMINFAKQCGLKGKELLEFLKEKDQRDREERERKEKLEREEREKERERREKLEKEERERQRQERLEKEEREREREEKERERREKLEREERERERQERLAKEEREREREEKERERERQERLEKEERELEREEREREAQRQHELQMRRLELEHGVPMHRASDSGDRPKAPKLPAFVDGKDDLDNYLERFERFAIGAGWNQGIWASNLSALLSGRALDVYSRLSREEAKNYAQLKDALLRRYDFTEEGYRRRFRDCRPEVGESPEQFIVRLEAYLKRWVQLSGTQEDFQGLSSLIVREQFIEACPKDVATHLREQESQKLSDIAKAAERYLTAHNCTLASSRPKLLSA